MSVPAKFEERVGMGVGATDKVDGEEAFRILILSDTELEGVLCWAKRAEYGRRHSVSRSAYTLEITALALCPPSPDGCSRLTRRIQTCTSFEQYPRGISRSPVHHMCPIFPGRTSPPTAGYPRLSTAPIQSLDLFLYMRGSIAESALGGFQWTSFDARAWVCLFPGQ